MTHQVNYEELPIDIHYNKLSEWLVSRRHCQQNWTASALVVRDKINAAVKTLPDVKEVIDIIQSSKITYFHVKEIVNLLSQDTESGKKNIFGQYSNELTKEWADIAKLYEKDSVFLAESAQIISRNVNYEIPALKRQLARCQQIEKDCLKKETDNIARAADLRRKYDNACKKFGIEGKKVKVELYTLVKKLPEMLDSLSKAVQSVVPAGHYYGQFVNFLMQRDDLAAECVPMVTYINNKGNTTVYEWRMGRPPVTVIEDQPVIDIDQEEEATEDGDIDWGTTGEDDGTANGIDFGDDIDFDMSQITIESPGDNKADGAIDWGDETKKPKAKSRESSVISDDGVAKGDDALSILEALQTRNLLMEDLMELEFFLNQRLVEINAPPNTLTTSQFENAPQDILLSADEVSAMASTVQAAWKLFDSEYMKHLLQIKRSPKYVERLAENLRQNLILADKMVFYEKETVIRRQETLREEQEVRPKLEILRKETQKLKTEIEEEISKKYNNRAVNIMGEINVI